MTWDIFFGGLKGNKHGNSAFLEDPGTHFLLETGSFLLNRVENAFLHLIRASEIECSLCFFGKYSPL